MIRTILCAGVALFLMSTAAAANTSRECLDPKTMALLEKVEARYGKVKLAKTCVAGATKPDGSVSWHARNRAFDFHTPKGAKQGEIVQWLGQVSSGVTIGYSGKLAGIIHADTGNYHKVIYRAASHEAGERAIAIWMKRDGHQVAEAAQISLDAFISEWAPVSAKLVNFVDYLIHTATVGRSMRIQSPEVSLGRLHPELRKRLAGAFAQARSEGMKVGCYSAYREPRLRIGGWRDKFQSQHSYGLACDVAGIGRYGSSSWKRWHQIATAHHLHNPYIGSRAMRWEWNHYSITPTKRVLAGVPGLRKTVTAAGPINQERMWAMANKLIDRNLDRERIKRRYARHHRIRVAKG